MSENMLRVTGRTFRLLLKAIRKASLGERIYFVVYQRDYARDLAQKALLICESYRGGTATIDFEEPGPVISFPDGGRLIFVSSRWAKDKPDEHYTKIYDHYQPGVI